MSEGTDNEIQDGARRENRPGWFATTRWSLVLNASDQDDSECSRALSNLCETYWQPLYAYIRQRGHSAHDAQDLTQ